MGSSSAEERRESLCSEKGLQGLIRDFKALQLEAAKNGDIKFNLKGGSCVRSHSIIIKSRCKNFKGETNYPLVSLDVFNLLLTYIYTGKLKVESTVTLFPLYLLSLEFGLDDLSNTSEELIISNLDQNSALTILQEAVDRSKINKQEELKVQRIIDTCVTHLSENNPGGLKRNINFLSLPSQTVLALLDSEHLCLEEEEVWRCVLRWAQHKASVDTHVGSWTDEERIKVSQYLTPVISHVRLLLIDSRVFAEEVEPTHCVPMALSLERYRYAALSNFESPVGTDPTRLTPRNAQKLFHSSLIINSERVALGKKLHEWYQLQVGGGTGNSNTNWKCIYRASSHGYSAADFHSRVDGVSPTYILVLLKNRKWICGGYTDVPWSSSKSPKYVSSSNSFLFSYSPDNNGLSVKFTVTKKHFAVCHDSNSGPIFGAGADLYISSKCSTNTESYSNLPHSYEMVSEPPSTATGLQLRAQGDNTVSSDNNQTSVNELLTPSYQFSIADYEVFTPNVQVQHPTASSA